MKRITFLSVLFILSYAFLLGCKKEKNIPLSELSGSKTPIFSVKGTIGKIDIDMVAGIDSAFLETAIDKRHGIDFFTGKMNKGKQSITMKISDGSIGINESILTKTKPLSLYSPLEIQSWINVNYDSLNENAQIQAIKFSVDEVEVGQNLTVYKAGWHDICVNITFNDQSERRLCNTVLLGYKDLGRFVINEKRDILNEQTQLSIHETESQIISVKWLMNGNIFSQEQNCTISDNQGVVEIQAEVTFSNGIIRRHTILLDTDNHMHKFPDIHRFIKTENALYYNDFKMYIGFSDLDNLSWGPITQESEISGVFTVQSISEYEKKNNGNTIYKVVGNIQGEFFDPTVDSYSPVLLNVVFGIEMP